MTTTPKPNPTAADQRAARNMLENRPTTKKLTTAQKALLVDLRSHGCPRTFNGRMGRTVRALAAAGYVTFEFDLVPCAIGKWTVRYTVTANPTCLSPEVK